MSDLTLHTIAQLRVAAHRTRQAVAVCARGAAERFSREQTGHDVLEYTGLIVFVAAAIVLLFTLQIPQDVSKALASAMNSVFSQGQTSYSAPTISVKG